MNNYDQIDLDKVKEDVAKLAVVNSSKSFILNEEVPFNPIKINRNISETNELLNFLNNGYELSFDGIEDITSILDKAKKNIILNSIEISNILNFHNHCQRIKNSLNSLEGELAIKDYTDSIQLDNRIQSELSKVVDNRGEIKDTASSKLKQIIDSINQNEKSLYDVAKRFINTNQDSLQEATTYIRNDRLTFLVKNTYKNRFNGYTYGNSASGLATYVEPEIFVSLNNNRISLLNDKEDEIDSILTNLTYLICSVSDDYFNNYESIVMLDVIYAKAKYGYRTCGVLGTLDEGELFLKDICHPLINDNEVVSNTYHLFNPYKGIVISGTNTGGKTVGLKCIGLSVLMTYLGIPIKASIVKVPLYNNVFIDIDDNQSIFNSLSTFSAHISNINYILNNASNKSLILIDELISGTDPKEAQAISIAILKKIERIGSNFVITTHYDDIKNYAYNNPNIMLSSVGFDNEKLVPTYKYIENSVGSSNALEIADRYFDDKQLIDEARSFISESKSLIDLNMDKLSNQITENELLKDKLTIELDKANSLIDEYNRKISNFEFEKEKLKNEYIDKLNRKLNDIKDRALDKLNSIKESKDSNVIKEIDELFIDEENESFKVGDAVKVGESQKIGIVNDIKGEKVEVILNGMSIKTTIDNLTKAHKVNKGVKTTNSKVYKNIKHELVLVGKHIDEALEELEIYLDDALGNGFDQVKIIHGQGSGQLRSAIRERLSKLKFVKSYNDGDMYDGGSSVTMVKLK